MWKLIVTLALLQNTLASANIADDFENYTKRMVPLSFDFAELSASFHEQETFLSFVGRAQTVLNLASRENHQALKIAHEIVSKLESTCPTLSGQLDEVKIYSGLRQHFLIKKSLSDSEKYLNQYRSLKNNLKSMCDGGFENYHFAESEFSILMPRIESEDGIYLSMGNLFEDLLNVLSSIFNFFSNESQKSRLEEIRRNFDLKRAQDLDIQDFARSACEVNRIKLSKIFESYDRIFQALTDSNQFIQSKHWSNHENFLLNCIRKNETNTVQSWIDHITNQPHDIQDSPATIALRNSRIMTEMKLIVIASRSGACSQEILNRIKSLEAVIEIYNPTSEQLKRAIRVSKENCRGIK